MSNNNEGYVAFDWENAEICVKVTDDAAKDFRRWKKGEEDEYGYFHLKLGRILNTFVVINRNTLGNPLGLLFKGPILIPTKNLEGCDITDEFVQWDLMNSTCFVQLSDWVQRGVLPDIDKLGVVKKNENGFFCVLPIYLFQIYEYMCHIPSQYTWQASDMLDGPIMIPRGDIKEVEKESQMSGMSGFR